LPEKDHLRILITSGASCPDTVLEEVIHRIIEFRPGALSPETGIANFMV
jgi:4-hydroxy-3-methylbut-2-enyl diphosphate reductase IspH